MRGQLRLCETAELYARDRRTAVVAFPLRRDYSSLALEHEGLKTESVMTRALWTITTAFVAVAVLSNPSPAESAPVVWPTIYDRLTTAGGGDEATAAIQADDFVLTSDHFISDVWFYTLELGDTAGYFGSVLLQFYVDDPIGGGPGGPDPFYEVLVTPERRLFVPSGDPNQNYFTYHAILDAFPRQLFPADTYWLAIHNGPLTNSAYAGWYWARGFGPDGQSAREDPVPFEGDWQIGFGDRAFLLQDRFTPRPVPEPFTVVLVGFGIAAVWKRRRGH